MEKIIFRADGNTTTGLGHLYRIFAMIEIYKKDHDYVLLVNEATTLSAIPTGYNCKVIPNTVTYSTEPQWLSQNFSAKEYTIVADGYQFDPSYQQKIKQFNYKLIYIDDKVEGKMYADAVINHAMGVSAESYSSEWYTKFALGTSYAILRPAFLNAAKQSREIKKMNSAFVCFGGADQNDLTLTTVEALLRIKEIEHIHVVVGAAYTHKKLFDKKEKQITVHKNLSEEDLCVVMSQCNLAVAPASTILYELCCVKMPVLSGFYVDNQKNIYEGCVKNGIVSPGGDFLDHDVNSLEKALRELMKQDPANMLKAQAAMFDGKITDRFLQLIKLNYRKANVNDLMLIYDWSNEKITRENSYNSDPIDLSTHTKWFENKLKDENTRIYICESDHNPVGLVRYEKKDGKATVGVLVSAEHRGKGLASLMLAETAAIYFKESSVPVYAYIKTSNIGSKRAFEKAGYKLDREESVQGHPSFVYKLEKNDLRK